MAVHLELVTDLTSESFIASLRRFVARRGKPLELLSDNGTSFVGASNELKALTRCLSAIEAKLINYCSSEGIAWKFIPPPSPHMGGLHESDIRLAKFHLKRILSNSYLCSKDFNTFLCQVEAIINSRPPTPLSSDPNDFSALTSAHMLIGRTLTGVADPSLIDLAINKLSNYQRLQQMQQHFRARWAKEYKGRKKWKTRQPNLELGSLVLIMEDNLPSMFWALCRVRELQPVRFSVLCRPRSR